MQRRTIDENLLSKYENWLYENERSRGTVKQYRACLARFVRFLDGKPISKDLVIRWKERLKKSMSPPTVNGFLAAVNGLLRFMGKVFEGEAKDLLPGGEGADQGRVPQTCFGRQGEWE